ncbi:MAG: hypothetical protein RR436_05880 [Clostridia bacterium]
MKKSFVLSLIATVVYLFAFVSYLLFMVPGFMKIFSGETELYPPLEQVNVVLASIIVVVTIALFIGTLFLCIKHNIMYLKGKVVSTDIVLVLLMYAVLICTFITPNQMIKAFPLYNQIWITNSITAFVYRFAYYGIGIYQIAIIFASFFAAISLNKIREKYAFDTDRSDK